MKTFYSTTTAGMTAFLFAALFAGTANARCVAKSQHVRAARAAQTPLMLKKAAPIQTPLDGNGPVPDPSIAGYWYVQFSAGGQLIDDGFDIWHGDGTEVLNDTTAPSAGDVCIGVWAKTGTLAYSLKHPTWIFDDAGINLIGVAVIREQINLDPGGNSFTGSSTFEIYDLSGNLLDEEVSDVAGTRITALDDPSAPATPILGLPAAIVNRAIVNQ